MASTARLSTGTGLPYRPASSRPCPRASSAVATAGDTGPGGDGCVDRGALPGRAPPAATTARECGRFAIGTRVPRSPPGAHIATNADTTAIQARSAVRARTRLLGLTRNRVSRTEASLVSVAIAPRAAIARPRPVPRRRSIPFPSLVDRDSQPRPVRKIRSTLEARYISERCSTPARAPCLAASAVPPDPASVARRDHWRDRAAHRPPHARRRSSARSPPRTVPARTPRSLGARRRPHATRHRPPARRPRDAKHRTPAPADDQGPPARSPTPGLNTASVPNSTGRAVREELGAQTHPPGLTNQRAIGIIRPRRLALP